MEIVLGNDATGDWQRGTPFGEIASLVLDIRGMSPRLSAAQASANSDGNEPVIISRNPGETLFRKLCTPCHTVGVGNRVGPDLFGVASRRTPDWLASFIMSPGKMRRSGDPAALALDRKFPGVKMPELGLSADDANDLILYLKAATERVEAAKDSLPAIPPHDPKTHTHAHAKASTAPVTN
jgi:protein SCO1